MAAPGAARGALPWSLTTWVQALALVGLCAELAVAVVEKGGFFAPQSTILLVWSLVLLAVAYGVSREAGTVRPEDVMLLALAAWWFAAAHLHGVGASFEPLGASLVGFVAAAAVCRAAPVRARRAAAAFVVAGGAASAVVGLVACDLRWFPIAARAQDLWRLSSTLTYANAAGILFAMCLLLATDPALRLRASPLLVAACTAGLVATQSRAGVLGAAVAFACLARRELLGAMVPVAVGVVAGLVTVASASGNATTPITLAVSLAVLCLAPVATRWGTRLAIPRRGTTARRRLLLVGGAVLLLVVAGVSARAEAVRRLDLGSDVGRLHEWRAALAQVRASVWTGVGPDQPLVLQGGATTYFAHDEYLQVLAGGGLVAAALLMAALALIVRAARVGAQGVRTARGALVVLAIGGLFDYTWHLPAIGLLGGTVLGLAQLGGRASGAAHIRPAVARDAGSAGPEPTPR